MRDRYLRQVRLLLNVLPDVASEPVFALKGGTAINLFYREMPRLSVDIDLAYVPVRDRRSSLAEIDDALSRFAAAATSRNPGVRARCTEGGGETGTRIVLSDGPTHIKVETSPVMRGTVYPARPMVVSRTVMDRYGFVEATVLAFEDLYGGQLVAALDRQHPPDVFDVKMPYDNEFVGMTPEAVPWTALVEARRRLVEDIGSRLLGDVAAFLLSVHDAEPDFRLIGLPRPPCCRPFVGRKRTWKGSGAPIRRRMGHSETRSNAWSDDGTAVSTMRLRAASGGSEWDGRDYRAGAPQVTVRAGTAC